MKINIALKISLIYLVLGFFWILFSDQFLMGLTDEFIELSVLQTYKGWFYVLITAFLLYWLVQREIMKKNKLLDELKEASLKAEESDRMKSAFLANMSHEIRTPLNGILGFGSLLQEGDYPEEQKQEFIKHVITNGNNLLALINDIIDISQLQERLLSIVNREFELNELFDEIYANFSKGMIDLRKEQISFIHKKEMASRQIFVISDAMRITQILNNLISNAFKFTNEGEVVMGYKINPDGIEFFVSDTGIGIEEEQQARIFERFYTSHKLQIKERQFGLGLSICKGLVELMDGKIFVKSEFQKGSVFTFVLPLSYSIK